MMAVVVVVVELPNGNTVRAVEGVGCLKEDYTTHKQEPSIVGERKADTVVEKEEIPA